MQAKLTKKEFIEWLKTSEGKQFNVDLWYGFQCFDYANAGWKVLFGLLLKGLGAKDIPFANNFDRLSYCIPKYTGLFGTTRRHGCVR